MSFDADADAATSSERPSDDRRIRLIQGGAILFEDRGFRLIEPRGLRRSPLHPYDSLTHVHRTERALLIGTTSGLLLVRSRDFADPVHGPEIARHALVGRVASLPHGDELLRAMARVEALSKRPLRLWATWTTALLCLIGTGFQLAEPFVDQVGSFVPALFQRGELWRGVTAHFLHALPLEPGPLTGWIPGARGLPVHLAINVAGLLVLGPLVERPLGSARTTLVLLLGGVGTIAGIVLAEHLEVVGASGLVAALAGAILALELHHPEAIPAEWRLPRRLFIVAVVLQFGVLDPLMRSFIAGGAHLGGFVGGFLGAWWIGVPDVEHDEAASRMRLAAAFGVFTAAVLGYGVMPLARHDPAALERHAVRLLDVPADVPLFLHDNAAAWLIATDGQASPEGLELAVALADRAVESTARRVPGVLDTLAEALFQTGDRLGAILTIDEAIRLVPHERYFIEQRRRFTGERPADDRPSPLGSQDGTEGEPDLEQGEPIIDPHAPRLTL
ncbi:MAG: rhomboid family intramembrane serine protease [Myxococcota bacterium]